MAMAHRLCLLLFLVFAIVCTARNPIFLSEEDISIVVGTHGRSLKATLNDYGDPSANSDHNPWSRGGSNRRGGRRNP